MSGAADLPALWWGLPGPRRFLELVQAGVLAPAGCVALALPRPAPEGLVEALVGRLRSETLLRVLRTDASAGLQDRPPAHWLAAFAGVATATMGSVGAFLGHPALRETVFVVDGVAARDRSAWGLFARTLAAERAAAGRDDAPALLLGLPPDLPAPDRRVMARGAADLPWLGRIRRADSEAYAEACLGHPADDLVSRVAMAVTIELGAWDPALIRALAILSVEKQIDPVAPLMRQAGNLVLERTLRWADGWVDRWDGEAVPHTLALLAAGDVAAVRRRLWRAHVRELFPFVETVRVAFARRFGPLIADALKADPVVKEHVNPPKIISVPEDLELTDLFRRIKHLLGREDGELVQACIRVRRAIAHLEPVPREVVLQIARLWEARAWLFPDPVEGWQAPDAGQTLTLLVGPPCAGKSTLAARDFDPAVVVSSDAVRRELFGRADDRGPQEEVLAVVHGRARALLAAGRSAVIDATHLEERHRAASRRLAAGRRITYLVVDRPLERKLADRGWRSEELVRRQHEAFVRALPEVLSGDGDATIDVRVVGALEEHRAAAE